ncbi:MAG: acyl-CoA thioesterase [Halobacteria archaeon]|nr:acyl-CoA thioesterase [Halobacteria archaeon]
MPTLSETRVENTQIVRPNHANNYNTAHGGNVVKWMDDAGVISATRFSGEPCVTASIGKTSFHSPLQVGDAAVVRSYVYKTGETSMKVHVKVFSESLRNGERELTSVARFIYVAVNDNGKPTTVPDLEVETDEEEEMRQEAIDEEKSD